MDLTTGIDPQPKAPKTMIQKLTGWEGKGLISDPVPGGED